MWVGVVGKQTMAPLWHCQGTESWVSVQGGKPRHPGCALKVWREAAGELYEVLLKPGDRPSTQGVLLFACCFWLQLTPWYNHSVNRHHGAAQSCHAAM
jgi:hypothetical protein